MKIQHHPVQWGLAAALLLAGTAAAAPKRVLHYTKIGGYNHASGIQGATAALNNLAAQYGFTVRHTDQMADLRQLNDYDVVIYDNNVNGQASTPGATEQKAVIDYITGGGSYLGYHGAGDHHGTWSWYNDVLFDGARFVGHDGGTWPLYRMDASLSNPAVKRMWDYLENELKAPSAQLTFNTEEYFFNKSVIGVPGVIGLQDIRGNAANYANHVMTWTRPVGKGRMLYTALGHGATDFTQNNEWLIKATWTWMKYLTGDFDATTGSAGAPVRAAEAIRLRGDRLDIATGAPHAVRVTSLAGRTVLAAEGSAVGSYRLPPGAYLVQVKSAGASHARHVVVN